MCKFLVVRCLFALALFGLAPLALAQEQEVPLQTLKPLIDSLKAPDREARLRAATDIGRMGPRAKAAVPALTEMLSAPASDNIERMAAAMALGQLGPAAKDAIPALQQAAKSGDDGVAKVADLALRRINPPISERIAETVMSPYVLASLLALGGGLIALFLLGWRRVVLDREVSDGHNR